MKNVRALAAQVLIAAEKQFVDEALEAQRGAALSRRDKALLTTLAYARWGKGHAAYGRLGVAGAAGLVVVAVASIAIAYWQVRGLA